MSFTFKLGDKIKTPPYNKASGVSVDSVEAHWGPEGTHPFVYVIRSNSSTYLSPYASDRYLAERVLAFSTNSLELYVEKPTFKVGDKVRVIKKVLSWKYTDTDTENSWIPSMDKYIGTKQTVQRIFSGGIVLTDIWQSFPPESLELINQENNNKMSERLKPFTVSGSIGPKTAFVALLNNLPELKTLQHSWSGSEMMIITVANDKDGLNTIDRWETHTEIDIDKYGGFDEALAYARKLAKQGPEKPKEITVIAGAPNQSILVKKDGFVVDTGFIPVTEIQKLMPEKTQITYSVPGGKGDFKVSVLSAAYKIGCSTFTLEELKTLLQKNKELNN